MKRFIPALGSVLTVILLAWMSSTDHAATPSPQMVSASIDRTIPLTHASRDRVRLLESETPTTALPTTTTTTEPPPTTTTTSKPKPPPHHFSPTSTPPSGVGEGAPSCGPGKKSWQQAYDCYYGLIAKYPWPADRAFRIMYCESTGDPMASNGSHWGLFQEDTGPYWDAETNISVAYNHYYAARGSTFGAWTCR